MSETLYYHDGKGYKPCSSIFDGIYFVLSLICEYQGILNAFGTFVRIEFVGHQGAE